MADTGLIQTSVDIMVIFKRPLHFVSTQHSYMNILSAELLIVIILILKDTIKSLYQISRYY